LLLFVSLAAVATAVDVLVVGSTQNWQIQADLGHRSFFWRKQNAENFSTAEGGGRKGQSGDDKHTKKCWQCKNLYRRKGRKMQAADKRMEKPTKWVPTGSADATQIIWIFVARQLLNRVVGHLLTLKIL